MLEFLLKRDGEICNYGHYSFTLVKYVYICMYENSYSVVVLLKFAYI